ncbi:hypothetical protein B0H16DRAFT_883743 [Mycena metata]|uniref:Pentatricopeptide repeat-containing protein n=1 Tax=Mycena metata TaxID=1033252 RepID=A0AAD7K6S4_9AGAR|nr:hypothetical protein B0H16DRAFT_883743 [Mycena metata]
MTHILRTRGLHKRFQTTFLNNPGLRSRCKTFSSTPTISDQPRRGLNPDLLLQLVERGHYKQAERLRLNMVSDSIPIEPNPIYELAALAKIRWHAAQDREGFLTWLQLVPDNKDPSQIGNGPFKKTFEVLFRTGRPAKNLDLISQFCLICAAKGYHQLVWDDLVDLMGKFQKPNIAMEFFLAFEAAMLRYYSKNHPGFVEETASRQRHLLIMFCCDVGWLDEAVWLIQDPSAHLSTRACERLIHLLRVRQGDSDLANITMLEQCLQRQRPARTPTSRDASHSPKHFSTRAIIEGLQTHQSRTWIASQLRNVKRLLSQRSLVLHRPPGNSLHSFMAHYNACRGSTNALSTLRKRALIASDPCSHTWLCKEMFYLHEARKFAEIIALFDANFESSFLPHEPWRILRAHAPNGVYERHVVPTRLEISGADAWVIWNALVRLSASVDLPTPLRILETLHHSAVHFSSMLTDRQFRAFPTSYTAVFRSIIWAYGELGEVDKAAAAAGDMTLIGKLHPSNVGLVDELAGVHARAGNVRAATRLLDSVEQLGPRLAPYGVLMDAYLQKGRVDEALKLEVRMKEKCVYIPGANWRMDSTLKALRAAEEVVRGLLFDSLHSDLSQDIIIS